MKRKFIVLCALTAATVLVLVSVLFSIDKDRTVKNVVNEMNFLTKDVIKTLGNPVTIQSVQESQRILDERKAGFFEKIKKLKELGDFSESSEIADELNACRAVNKDKLAVVYNKVVKKSYDDANVINDLKKTLPQASTAKSIREINKQIDEKTKDLEITIDVLADMGRFVNDFETTIDTK